MVMMAVQQGKQRHAEEMKVADVDVSQPRWLRGECT
jgi:hypothetical protein